MCSGGLKLEKILAFDIIDCTYLESLEIWRFNCVPVCNVEATPTVMNVPANNKAV